MLRRRRQKAGDIAARGKIFADGAQHDHAHAVVLVKRLEDEPQLIALSHFDNIERRPVQHDIGALARGIDLDAETVELLQTQIGKPSHAVVPCWRDGAIADGEDSTVYSPATSLRRRSLPTGDFGISATKT